MHFFAFFFLSLYSLAWMPVQSCKFIAAYNFPLENSPARDLYVLEIKLKYKFGFKEHHLFSEDGRDRGRGGRRASAD